MRYIMIAVMAMALGACAQPVEATEPLAQHDAVVARYARSQIRMCVKLDEPKCLIAVAEQLASWCSVYEGEGCSLYEEAEAALDEMIN